MRLTRKIILTAIGLGLATGMVALTLIVATHIWANSILTLKAIAPEWFFYAWSAGSMIVFLSLIALWYSYSLCIIVNKLEAEMKKEGIEAPSWLKEKKVI